MFFRNHRKSQELFLILKKEKLDSIKIELYDSQNVLVKSLFTNSEGNFSFENLLEQSFKIKINDEKYLSFEKLIDAKTDHETLNIILKNNQKEIEAVTLTKKKPLVKRKVDRLEFNVENSNISSLNAWEILKKTPQVIINNDVLAVKGGTSVLLTINDKKVMMSGEELKNFLENTQGDDVKSIEVITNPPAKYEAEGGAVLNIVMKKNKIEGYRGILSSKYVQTQYAKGVAGLAQYYKKDKLSFMAGYFRGTGTYYREGTDFVNYAEDGTTWISTMNRKDQAKSQNTINFNVEYEIDSLTTASLNYSGYFNPKSFGTYNVPTLIYNSQNVAESNYTTINDHYSRTINNSLSFQVDRKLNKKSSLSWINYFTGNNESKYQNVLTYLNFANQNQGKQIL